MKKLLISFTPIIISLFCSSSYANPDPVQQFYHDGEKLISQFRSCSLMTNQFSLDTFKCIENSQKNIQDSTKALMSKHAPLVAKLKNEGVTFSFGTSQESEIKRKCAEIYPTPLKNRFKNQIKSCETQIDLNIYLKTSNDILTFM